MGSGVDAPGLTVIPDSMKAGARWQFDRAYGLEGDRTFAILWAYHAGYLLMNYPLDVEAKPPTESLPWIAPDLSGVSGAPVLSSWSTRRAAQKTSRGT